MLALSARSGAWKIVRSVPVRTLHAANRKELIPLIKQIHPDLSANQSDLVRAHNMTCIQNLNDLWDTLETNINSTAGRNLSFGVDVKSAFRAKYDLTCYVTTGAAKDGGNGEEKLEKVDFTLSIPEIMCRKQTVTQKSFVEAVQLILTQQGRLFSLAGLQNPWKSATQAPHQREGSKSVPSKRADLSTELETFIFEKWVTKNNKHNRTGSLSNNQGRSDFHRLYNPKYNHNSAELDTFFGNKLAQESFFGEEADAFFKNGNVMVADLSANDEFLTVKKIRKMFVNFGDVLNFSSDKWRAVYLLLYQYGGKERYISGPRTNKNKKKKKSSIESTSLDDNDSEDEKNSHEKVESGVTKVVNGGFVLETHGQQYILRVPHDFRTKHLLDFAGKELPAAQMVLR